jgi:hypothetical protein
MATVGNETDFGVALRDSSDGQAMKQAIATLDGITFRWSMSKIRSLASLSGVIVMIVLTIYVLGDLFLGERAPGPQRLNPTIVGLSIALAAACIAAAVVAAILLVGRMYSKVVVTAAGLYIVAALWRKDCVEWKDIGRVETRKVNGWRYLYITPMFSTRKIALSLEMDEPEEFARLVAAFTEGGNPIRTALKIDKEAAGV